MFDLKSPSAGPQKLLIEGSFLRETPDFTPHGMGHWINSDGLVFLYVINHRRERDTIECFLYNAESLSLKHRKTIQHSSFSYLNDLVLVGLDELYVTHDHYFSTSFLSSFEEYMRLPWTFVTYYNGGMKDVKIATTGLALANGIAKSNNGK